MMMKVRVGENRCVGRAYRMFCYRSTCFMEVESTFILAALVSSCVSFECFACTAREFRVS
jgi:hypothetical protein